MRIEEAHEKSKFGQCGCQDTNGDLILVFAEYGLRCGLMEVYRKQHDAEDWKMWFMGSSVPAVYCDWDTWEPIGPRK